MQVTDRDYTLGEPIESRDPFKSALGVFGDFEGYEEVHQIARAIEAYRIFDPSIAQMRQPSVATDDATLNDTASNPAAVIYHYQEQHPEIVTELVERLAVFVPSVTSIEAERYRDGNVFLLIGEAGAEHPLSSQAVSDGTITLLVYLALLLDPKPQSLLAIEEPEQHIYPHHLGELTELFRDYAERGGQVIMTTHSPDLLNAIELEELRIVKKTDGVSEVLNAFENPAVADQMAAGAKLGELWREGFFD